MRAALVMPGQPYRLGHRHVTVDVVHRGGRVVLTDGTVTAARCLTRTPDQAPGSRTTSEPWRVRCASCAAPAGARCVTRRGTPTADHAIRVQMSRVGVLPTAADAV